MSSEKPPKLRAGVAWYRNGTYYRYMAEEYLRKLGNLDPNSQQELEIYNSIAFNRARLIFESNLIEGAGLPSEGDTQKLIEDNFPALPGQLRDYTPLIGKKRTLEDLLSKDKLKDIRRVIKNSGLPPEKVIPSVSFAGQSRAYREVLQHYQTLDYALYLIVGWAASTHIEAESVLIKWKYEGNPKTRDDELLKLRKKFNTVRIRHKRLLTHTNLKNLHRVLAHGLMPDDADVRAGKYRIDNRSIGWDITFPAAELVQKAMDNFVQRSDKLLMDFLKGDSQKDVFQLAAEISYHFVRVHPFPDFNGRLSRIIMNMVLMTGSCPIPIAIKGDKTGRQRYFTALRHANRGKMESLSALIAMRVTETFQEIDENLKLAGLPTIWSMKLDKQGSGKPKDGKKKKRSKR